MPGVRRELLCLNLIFLGDAPSCGPVAQLGARFHGMEEVVGSNPTRSTIFSITYRLADQSVGSIWQQIPKTLSACPQIFWLHSQFLMNGVDGCAHALWDLLHIHVGGRRRA
jgi:hypothetical protein